MRQGEAADRRRSEHHGEQVVPFKQPVPRLVMAAVPAPEGAMHDVAVDGPGNRLHPPEYENGERDLQRKDEHRDQA